METIIAGTIAITYAYLIRQFSFMLFKQKDNESKWNSGKNLKRFSFQLSVAIASLIASLFISDKNIKYGIALGSAISLLTSIYMNWDNLTNDMRTMIVSVVFLILIAIAYYGQDKFNSYN